MNRQIIIKIPRLNSLLLRLIKASIIKPLIRKKAKIMVLRRSSKLRKKRMALLVRRLKANDN